MKAFVDFKAGAYIYKIINRKVYAFNIMSGKGC